MCFSSKARKFKAGFFYLSEKSPKIIHFCAIFLRNFLEIFKILWRPGGSPPPDPLRGRPPKMSSPPNRNPGGAAVHISRNLSTSGGDLGTSTKHLDQTKPILCPHPNAKNICNPFLHYSEKSNMIIIQISASITCSAIIFINHNIKYFELFAYGPNGPIQRARP